MLRTGRGHGRGRRRPFDYAQGRPYGCMVGRAGERWKGEVAVQPVKGAGRGWSCRGSACL